MVLTVAEGILGADPAACLRALDQLYAHGYDPQRFCRDLLEHFRHLAVLGATGERALLADLPEAEVAALGAQTERRSADDLQRFFRLLLEADEVLSAPELARILDRAFAGSLPEEVARSIVRHRVLERVVSELAESGELQRLVQESLGSPRTLELTDQVLASDEMQRLLQSVASSPELRSAVARQSAGLAEEVVAGARRSAIRLDRRIGRQPTAPAYAGVATRGAALAFDALVALVNYFT